MSFPVYIQHDQKDCGPTCLRMIAKYYGKNYTLQTLKEQCHISREGVSMLGISDAAENIGMRTLGTRISIEKLIKEKPVPFIAHWKQEHFVVVYDIKKKGKNYIFYIADPAHGIIKYRKEEFKKQWLSTSDYNVDSGICLLLEPSPDFYILKGESDNKKGFRFLFKYLKPHKKFFIQLVLGLIFGSLLQLIFPFLTQSVVDIGITNQDLDFILLILIAQMVLFISRMSVEFIRSWILLHISTRINISLISDFLIKLMKLPIGYFDTKMVGDIMQRIGDHKRIESFLTTQTLSTLFSFVNLIVFGIILAIYSLKIFGVFILGSGLYIFWVNLFMKKRRELDHKRFSQSADNQSNLFQLITGMQEIKLNNCEKQKRWEWERIQASLFKISVKGLTLSQYQQSGSVFINETKNIVITFLAATAVVEGNMTLGMMLAVQYIIGQLNAPVSQILTFLHSLQDARISLERLGEIHNKKDEEDSSDPKLAENPGSKNIKVKNLSFQYEGPHSKMVLKNISLEIPANKTTAIVGTSGSGKTTLVKLLLGFYQPIYGEILIGNTAIQNFSSRWWRSKCGAVMQDGFIFSDSIAKNIGISDEILEKEKLFSSVKVANIKDHIDSLPLGYNTKIGQEGSGISLGQKQRILIARAVYKNPEYLFFDEATNALDANNEKVIMKNLEEFFKGRTVVVVAHRLSTVKNADKIVVLEKGEIVETGTHEQLTLKKGYYYNLVRNQLELGN